MSAPAADRAAELVARWVRFYTQELPAPIARRRVDEIDVDLHDHIAHESSRGTSDRRIALGILSRMVRGLISDVAWRRRIRPLRGDLMERLSPVLLPVIGIVALGVAAIVFGEADDAPGLVMLGLLLIVAAVAFGVSPALRTKSRILGLLVGAVVLTAIGAGIAGWLENTF